MYGRELRKKKGSISAYPFIHVDHLSVRFNLVVSLSLSLFYFFCLLSNKWIIIKTRASKIPLVGSSVTHFTP